MPLLRRRFLAVPGSAAKARSAVSLFSTLHGFSGDELSDIETAVGEAVANAIEHGNRMRGAFTIVCSFDDGVLRVAVSDAGAGFDDSTKPQVDTAPERRAPSLRGYGIYLMRTLMNSVSFEDGGTTVVLEKRYLGCGAAAGDAREAAP